jgi:diadenosine tetraphosphate (Ap4A) HIT family hydrolase
MPNATMLKFGYPGTLIREYDSWVVLLKPAQMTVGSLMLASKLDVEQVSHLPAEAFAELAQVTGDIESVLKGLFAYDRINYLLFMLVDPQVHFHVLPRYETPRDVVGVTFVDPFWPKPPAEMSRATPLTPEQHAALLSLIKDAWPRH